MLQYSEIIETELTLKDVYLDLIKSLAQSSNLEVKHVRMYNIVPTFERIAKIEDLSYLILDKKIQTILKHYYQPHLTSLKSGKEVILEKSSCVERIFFDGDLNVKFRRARIFPTLYCDLIVLSIVAEELRAIRINLDFSLVSARIIAPYFKALIDRLEIKNISKGSSKWIDYMMKVYRDAIIYSKIPRFGHLLKLIAFYYCTVEKRINRTEARYLYYYFRKCANLKLFSGGRYEDGYKVYLKLLSELRSNTSQ